MSSLKMTFSLASLVLILGLVFAIAPAMAQDTVEGMITFTTGTVPAKGYVVISAVSPAVNNGLPATGLTDVQWEQIPDLEKLFRFNGGTLHIAATKSVTDGTSYALDRDADDRYEQNDYNADGLIAGSTPGDGDGIQDAAQKTWAAAAAATRGDAPTTAETPNEDAKVSDLIVTEIMWARDENMINQTGQNAHQWIEIYNKLDIPFPLNGITITAKSGPGAANIPTVPATHTLLDRVSNVFDTVWTFDLGQDGSTKEMATKEFISMYRKERGKNGWTKGHWGESTEIYLTDHKGTPGTGERPGVKEFTTSGVSLDVVFNEVSNQKGKTYEWLELMVRNGTPNFENWHVRFLTDPNAAGQKLLFTLPKIDKYSFAAGDVLLITATDPADDSKHPLAAGYDVTKSVADNEGTGRDKSVKYIVVDWKEDLPDNGLFVLILRSNKDKTNHETVVDIAGYDSDLAVNTKDNVTKLWPLINYPAPTGDNNALVSGNKGSVHVRRHADIAGTSTKDGNKADKVAWERNKGWTGLGYKRNADANAINGGTPGYPNNALVGDNNADAIASVVISEVMAVAGSRNLPEWIELQNLSDSIGVNLNGWRLSIVNHNEDGADGEFAGDLTHTVTLSGIIPPKQTFLIAARRGRNDTNLPKERIQTPDPILKRGDLMLNPYGFQVKLEAKKDANYFHVDTVGNLGAAPATSRRSDAQSFEPIAWELPALTNDDGDRISLVQVGDGTLAGGLVRFDMSNQIDSVVDPTSYGHDTDQGSPGHHPGGVLPVSLSKFRPERMKDTGAVVVRWITESELNNAGFNILRSDTRDGEFTKLNTKLIAGHGTTSERNTYEYADTSAKPNVIYYYQIQDVSLDGQVTPLAITHLRGNVTAAGKLTTTWAELKALQ